MISWLEGLRLACFHFSARKMAATWKATATDVKCDPESRAEASNWILLKCADELEVKLRAVLDVKDGIYSESEERIG
jgi:hypothetical protein